MAEVLDATKCLSPFDGRRGRRDYDYKSKPHYLVAESDKQQPYLNIGQEFLYHDGSKTGEEKAETRKLLLDSRAQFPKGNTLVIQRNLRLHRVEKCP